MAQAAVIAAVSARLAALWTLCPVADNNRTGETPAEGSAFLVVQYPIASEQQIGIGTPGAQLYRETGAIRFVLNVPRGAGLDLYSGWADTLRALFRSKQFSDVNTWAPSSPVLDNSNTAGTYWRLTFAVPYYFDFIG